MLVIINFPNLGIRVIDNLYMLYNRKDITMEQGKAFFVGFVVALGIGALFLLVFNVHAQTLDPIFDVSVKPALSPIQVLDEKSFIDMNGKQQTVSIPVEIPIDQMDNVQLIYKIDDLKKNINELNTLASKYAKLYDTCKTK